MNNEIESKRSIEEVMASIKSKIQKRTIEESAKGAAVVLRNEIPVPSSPLSPQEQSWLPFAPMPSDLCRVSPFFPLNPRDLSDRPFIQGMIITKSAWGEITYTGPKLSVFDEDVLLAVLALLDSKSTSKEVEVEERRTLVYHGPLLPLLKLMGCTNTGPNYKRVIGALERLTYAGLKIKTSKGHWMLTTILSGAVGQDGVSELSIAVNPYFFEMYATGAVSLLDVVTRSKLSRPTAKALYRFATSHRGTWRGHFLTLAAAINLDLEQPHFKMRALLKAAMSELKKNHLIGSMSRFDGQDVVVLEKKDALSAAKKQKPRTAIS